MREIKFRAFCPAYKNHGEFQHSSDYDSHMTYSFSLFHVPDDLPDDAVIMQFTGLHDKNGKEIWEGDIVKGQHLSGAVCFGEFQVQTRNYLGDDEDDVIGWFIRDNHPKTGEPWNRPMDSYMKYCEVIGNIYEHRELLA